MRAIFYSITTIIVLLALIALSELTGLVNRRVVEEQVRIMSADKSRSYFESTGADLGEILKVSCYRGSKVDVQVLFPVYTSMISSNVSAYGNFTKKFFQANLDTSALEASISGGSVGLNISGREIDVDYSTPSIDFPLDDGFNLTLDFEGVVTNLTWSPSPSGSVPVNIYTPGWNSEHMIDPGTNYEVRISLNNTGGASAGWIDIDITSGQVNIDYGSVLWDSVGEINSTIALNETADAVIIPIVNFTYGSELVNISAPLDLC